ncbi:3-methyl-2-oxobutanoate hydroxymethyltransferase, partial [Pseudomonas aeruginosa]|uniref:3-methyl-2-oxobutanoate hydroxymethyltransferase n=1 Tax=Pseudomonas aeruginosa TaxID=287 RepID=UPI0029529F18
MAMLTCYDATFAHTASQAGVDVLLVGDSLGMVLQGHDSTLPVAGLGPLGHADQCLLVIAELLQYIAHAHVEQSQLARQVLA